MTFPLSTPIFVVIEGLDGAGTTTQTGAVADALASRGQPVSVSREPSDGPVGMVIRQMLSMRITVTDDEGRHKPVGRQTLALLFAADRMDHLEAEVEPALERGEVAISDRYYHSSLAYQGDVDGRDSADFQWVESLNSRARTPDLTVFLEATADLCLQRLDSRGRKDIYETRDKLERLERRYDEVMKLLEERGEKILRLDASLPAEKLTEEVVEAVRTLSESGQ